MKFVCTCREKVPMIFFNTVKSKLIALTTITFTKVWPTTVQMQAIWPTAICYICYSWLLLYSDETIGRISWTINLLLWKWFIPTAYISIIYLSSLLSWTSSTIMCETPSRLVSLSKRLRRIPVVQNNSLVDEDCEKEKIYSLILINQWQIKYNL